jgi:formate dehydrogenase iron-sulfur subunit
LRAKDLRHPSPDTDVSPEGDRASLSRRAFLKTATVAAGTAGILGHSVGPAHASGLVPESNPQVLAREHADDPGLLVDLTRCVGCGECVRACKLDNDLGWRADQPATGPEAVLASSNWSVVRAVSVETVEDTLLGPRPMTGRRYVKTQCMHCLEPACASACFVKALVKSDAGPVVYDPDRCVGCRYCMMACPFGVPAYEWEATLGRIQKCDLCVERTSEGRPTTCAEACPQGAIAFGRRDELLAEARARIEAKPDVYVHHIFGQTEVGGTSVLYLSDVPFEELGFPTTLPDTPLPQYTWKITRLIPPAAASIGATLITLYVRRRRLVLDEEAREGAEEVSA